MADRAGECSPEVGPGRRTPTHIAGPIDPTAARCHLVVGFDRHSTGRAALDYAIRLAGRLDAFLHVAHIIDSADLPIDPDSAFWERTVTDTVEQERRDACALLDRAPGPWAYYSRSGHPAEVLSGLADAHHAEMIIIGASRGGPAALLQRLTGESVSARLVRHARRPVLLVPVSGRKDHRA